MNRLSQPHLSQPYLSQPYLSQPYLSQPYLSQPYLSQPGLSQPYLSQPGLSQPGLSQPYLSQPCRSRPVRFIRLVSFLCLGALAFLVPMLGASPVSAQPEAEEQPEGEQTVVQSQEFRPMEGPAQEDVPGGALMVGAYGLLFLFLLLFLLRLQVLQAATARDVTRLEQSVSSAVAKGGADKGKKDR
ncbi:MAG: hypothetical protein AAGF12_34715 [Myxococcota bacterium]